MLALLLLHVLKLNQEYFAHREAFEFAIELHLADLQGKA
jgi:hypothetical protein